jgi:NitT/TauT family transport system substrate-binding protein
MMKKISGFIAVVSVILALSWPAAENANGSEAAEASRRTVSFVPQWIPQAQFAGYYVAFEKGFYSQHGVKVNILRGGPERPSAEWLKKGAADFGTMLLSAAIAERAKGTGLVNVGQIVSKSSQTLVAKKSSGINSWQDINGRKVGLWGAELSILPMALFKLYGLKVTAVPQSSTVNLFLRGGVDVASVMWYNEYHSILDAGVEPEELVTFRLSDFGTDHPEDGIYCLESTLKKDPQSCCRFVQASVEGWKYAFEHPEEALDIVMKYVSEAKVSTNRQHQKWMLSHMREVIDLPENREYPAPLTEEGYMAVAGGLKAGGIIEHIPAFTDFLANCAAIDEK